MPVASTTGRLVKRLATPTRVRSLKSLVANIVNNSPSTMDVIHKDGVAVMGIALATSGTATGVKGVTEGSSLFSQDPPVISGVHGFANAGIGVRGDSISGVGVVAATQKGIALQVEGKAFFRTAGEGSIASGKSSAKVANAQVT